MSPVVVSNESFVPSEIVGMGRARKHVLVEAANELIGWIGEIASDLLLDRAALLSPSLLRIVDTVQARRLGLKSHIEIGRRDSREVLARGRTIRTVVRCIYFFVS
jgi:hypothetical protein